MGRWLSFMLGRRYVISVVGDPVPEPGKDGPFLILPNHPALVDPLIVYSRFSKLRPRPLVGAPLARAFGMFFSGTNPIVMPEAVQEDAPAVLQRAVEEAVDTLSQGRSVVMWPGERLQDNGREVLRGKSGVYRLLRTVLDRDMVLPELFLVRTEGLWGSRFSRYFTPGCTPGALSTFVRQLPAALWGPLLPKRQLRVVLRRHKVSTADCVSMERINNLLARWYDAGPQAATLVPRMPGTRVRHEAARTQRDGAIPDVDIAPALALLAAHVPVEGAGPQTRLLEELGIDSRLLPLVMADIRTAAGCSPEPERLTTVAEVAAALQDCGKSVLSVPEVTPENRAPTGVLRENTEPEDVTPVLVPTVSAAEELPDTVTPALLRVPPLLPVQHAITRQGTVTDMTLGLHFSRRSLMGLSKAIGGLLRDVPGGNVGVALPGGVGAMAAFIACLDSTEEGGRTPVFFNFHMSPAQLEHCAVQAGVTHVLTSEALQGRGLPPNTTPLYLERISKGQMRRGYAASLWGFAGVADVDAPAAVLFTSGTEAQPKGVRLTHRNLMQALRSSLNVFMGPPLRVHSLSVLCGLPPYHALGLLSNVLLPLTCGVPAITVSDPGDATLLAQACRRYGVSFFVGTPSQLKGMLQIAPLPLRWAVVGAEPCPPDLEALFHERCPNGVLVEGYGTTECAAAVSANVTRRPGSVGKLLPTLEHTVHEGQLYVRGESVFSGYLDGSDPRVALPGAEDDAPADWYPTGDAFEEDAQGFLLFRGRLRRMVKRGEEMISLAALEAALGGIPVADSEDGRIIAVSPGIPEPKELNTQLRDAGLPPPWRIDASLDAIVPLLPNGKVDYLTLKELV